MVHVTLSGATLNLTDLLATAPTLDTITVGRLVGRLYVYVAGPTTTIQAIQLVDVGVGVLSQEAAAIGGTSVPSPAIDADAPPRGWLYRSRVLSIRTNADGSEKETNNLIPVIDFDVRSMRKVDKGSLRLILVKSLIGGTVADLTVSGLVRALCLT